MNLTEYAKQMGISKATIYRKLTAAGIDINTLRDSDGNITDDGLSIMAAALDGTSQKRSTSQACDVSETDELRRQLDVALRQLEAANNQIAELQRQAVERERANADAWKQYAERQQQLEAQRLLTTRRTTLFERIFGRDGKQ